MTDGATDWTIEGGCVLADGALGSADLALRDGRVAAQPAAGARWLDASGCLVLPGIVDVHGDGFERQIAPRPGVRFPLAMALVETDRQLVACGITTAFHGLSVSWEPGLRSVDSAAAFVDELERLVPALACDTKLHLRWEVFAIEAAAAIVRWLARFDRPILAFNDHTSGTLPGGRFAAKIERDASRAGVTVEAYRALVEDVWSRRNEVDRAVAGLARAAGESGAILLAHDEDSPATRQRYRTLGAVASEFPLNEPTARAARAAGEHAVLGAPNVVRGGSHNGALDATEAVRADLCSVLASDYFYPALLYAPFLLAERGVVSLPRAWDLVARNPAELAGLADRGHLAPGARGDVIVVQPDGPAGPRVRATFVAGRQVFAG